MRFHLLVFALPLWAAQPELPAELSLRQALDLAFRNSTALRRAAAQLDQARAQAAQTQSSYRPQVNLALADSVQTVNLRTMGIDVPLLPSRVGPFQVVDARAHLTQNVLNLPLLERGKAARERSNAVSELAGNARELVSLEVATAFARAMRAQSAAATLGRQLELANDLLGVTRDRFEAGAASRLEVARAEQQAVNLAQTLEEARHGVVAAKLQLANLLNASMAADFRLVESDPGSPEVSVPALEEALRARPDFRSIQARLKAAEFDVSAARKQRYPTVQFHAAYGQIGRKPFENLNTFQIQGSLNLPVYTGGRVEGEIAEAEGRLKELRALVDELRSQVEMEVSVAAAAAGSARRELEIASRGGALAREELDLARERFASGIADNTEIINAQERLSRAEDNAIRAAFNRDIALAQLRRALGLGGQL